MVLDFSAFGELVENVNESNKPASVSENPDRGFYQSGVTGPDRQFEPEALPKRGERGTDVSNMQQALVDAGVTSIRKVDGAFGINTEKGVQEFQEMNGLPETGIFDEATRSALFDDKTRMPDSDEAQVPAAEEVEVSEIGSGDKDKLIDSVFKAEGGYSTDKNDTGNYYQGKFVGTNHGISAPVLAEKLGRAPTVADMKALTKDEARKIAGEQYYDKFSLDKLPTESREIVFHAIYMGGSRGVRAMQNLLGLTPDGLMGPATRAAMENADFTKQEFRDEYLRELEFGTEGYSKPAGTWSKHGKGWTNRYNKLAK